MKTLKQFHQFLINNLDSAAIWMVFLLFLICFSIYFVMQERYVYVWDYAAYFDKYILIGSLAKSGFWDLFGVIHESMSEDYSFLAVAALLPFRLIFGPSRVSYVASIIVTYGFPSIFIIFYMIRKIVVGSTLSLSISSLGVMLAILFNPFYIQPIYLGYVDIVGTILIGHLYIKYFNSKSQNSLLGHIYLGFCLCFLLFLRRWYGYWIASFAITLLLYQFYMVSTSQKALLQDYMRVLFKNGITVYIVVLFSILVAPAFVFRALTSNYADIYSVFRNNPLTGFWLTVYSNFGGLLTLTLIVGIIIGLARRQTRVFSFLLLIQSLFTLFLFTRVQNVLDHQFNQFYPMFIFFMSIPILHGFKYFRQKKQIVYACVLLSYGLINFINVYLGLFKEASSRLPWVFTPRSNYPLIRTDLGALHQLNDILMDLVRLDPGKIYTLSYTYILNDETIRHVCVNSTTSNLCGLIQRVSGVDKRDGFPTQFFSSKYVVVADPIQDDSIVPQRTIRDLATDFLSGGLIQEHYQKLQYTITLNNDVKVSIFKKKSPLSSDLINRLSMSFQQYYPNNKAFIFSSENIVQ